MLCGVMYCYLMVGGIEMSSSWRERGGEGIVDIVVGSVCGRLLLLSNLAKAADEEGAMRCGGGGKVCKVRYVESGELASVCSVAMREVSNAPPFLRQ